MNIIPKDAPASSQSTPSTAQGMQGARERAIAAVLANNAKFEPNQSQQTPVSNPNQVSVEELTALSTTKSVDTGQPVTNEATQVTQEAAKEEPSLSSQYAQLARKEKALRAKAIAQQQEFKAKEAQIRAEVEAQVKAQLEAEYQTKYIPKDRFENEPWQALLDAGLTYDKVTELALSQPQDLHPAVKATLAKLEAKIQATESKQREIEESAKTQQQTQYNEAVRQLTNEAKSLVNTNDEFETIKTYGQVSEVVKLIERTYAEDNYLMSVEEAAREVENYLFEQLTKATKLKKFQKSQASAPQATSSQKQPESTQQSQKSPTLTNSVGTQRKLSAKERAMLAFKGQLK